MAPVQNKFLLSIRGFIRDRFNLDTDKANELETIEYITKGVEFKGPNLWILIFAIFIASIGLNVNSTAVIIGAMLISPLMGPILGIGLSVAIFDLDLLKKSLTSLGVAAAFSVMTSFIYFSVSPLSEARSELLARTMPTIWDVMIAFFGGLAGIVAGSRKEKSNAIPGVAIATALMPPLCTAGFGLATQNWFYFFGAFYLFFINSVFISLATIIIVRFLRYPKKEFVDEAREKRVKTIITLATLVTVIPSIYLGYNVVRHSIFERNAQNFVRNELNFKNSKVIETNFLFDSKPHQIEVTLFGEPLEESEIDYFRNKLPNYNLADCNLTIFQGYQNDLDLSMLQSEVHGRVVEELYKMNADALKSKDEQIKFLEGEVVKLRQASAQSVEIAPEIKALDSRIKEFALQQTIMTRMDSLKTDTLQLAYIKFSRKPARADINKLELWLQARTKSKQLRIITQ